MNDKMTELYAKACLDARDIHPTDVPAFIACMAAKFAESIVKECIKESMDEIVDDTEIALEKDPLIREYLKGNNQGIVDAVVRFRNHFGVEE